MAKRTKINDVFKKIMVEREAIGAVLSEFGKADNPVAKMQERVVQLDAFAVKLMELTGETEEGFTKKPTRTRKSRKATEPTDA